MKRVVFHPEAERELLREMAYYAKGRAGADARFLDAVQAAVTRAARYPLAGAPTYGEIRGIRVKGFPFSVVYRDAAHAVEVIAVSPHRKRPLYWLDRQD